MIGLALRLRVALLRGGLRPGPGANGRRIGLAAGALFGVVLSLFALGSLAALRGRSIADDVAVLVFTLLVVSWTVLPILTFSSDDLLDASKLSLYPLTTRQVLTLHGVGALVGIAPVATFVACMGLVLGTGTDAASTVVALVAVPLELALCVVTSRTAASLLSRLLRSRRGRDLGVALTALLAVSGQLLNPALQRASQADGTEAGLHRVSSVLALLPPGLVASAPRRARDGQLVLAVLQLVAVIGVLVLLLSVWARALRRSEESVDRTTSPARRSTSLTPRLLTRVLPLGRVGAVASKDLRYLVREPRRLVQLVTGTVFPAVFVVAAPALTAGGGLVPAMVFAVCGIALFSALGGSNRFGQDGTSTWLLVATGSDRPTARRDLLGGDVALCLVTIPLMVISGVLIAAVCDGWRYLAAAEGLALAILTIALGAAGLVSVLAPFPVPDNARNAFSNGGGGQGLYAALLVFGLMGAVVVACLPLLFLLLPVFDGGSGLPLLLLGPLYGVAVGALGRELAARQWAVRGPEVLLRLSSGRS